jgi:cAMP-dependent protein kinase regulator
MVETLSDFDLARQRFERLLKIPTEERTDDDLFELMRLTGNFKVFQSFKMSKIHKEICKYIYSRTLNRGEIIFKQGDEGDAYYFVLRGCVDIYMYDIDQKDGKTKLKFLASVVAGNGFGELALLYDCPRTATAIPNTKSDLVVIKKRFYTRLVKDLHEKELLSQIKFYYSITIFKKEPISNILKYCLRTNKKSLNSYEPFIQIGSHLNEYCIIQSGAIKCLVRIKINNYILRNSNVMSENDFVNYLKKLQLKKFNYQGEARPPETDLNSVYEEVLDIMEFGEKDMYGEYYAAKNKKIDVYFLPILPTDVITIKTDDLKKINPQLHETILKYARPIYDPDIAFRKLYTNLNWDKDKAGLLNWVVNKN